MKQWWGELQFKTGGGKKKQLKCTFPNNGKQACVKKEKEKKQAIIMVHSATIR